MTALADLLPPTAPEWLGGSVVLLGEYGSTATGTATASSDRDFMGVAVEPRAYVLGLRRFEHQQISARDPQAANANADDEGVIYGLRKWANLAAQGNPTVLSSLFLPHYAVLDEIGTALLENRNLFLSRRLAARFRGYLVSQRSALTGEKVKRVQRPELVAAHGYDTKYAHHMLRLGMQGVELLADGTLTLPMSAPRLDILNAVRAGEWLLADVLALAAVYETQLTEFATTSAVAEHPDAAKLDALLADTYDAAWAR